MTISFKCPGCSKPYNVPDQLAGKKSKCSCGHQFVIPAAAAAPAPTSPAPTSPAPVQGRQAPGTQPLAPANPLGQMPQTTGNPLGGMPTTPSGGNALGGMPLPPAGGNQFGGLPTGTGLPAGGGMPGGNPLGGMPGTPGMQGMQAGGWNSPGGGPKPKSKKTASGNSKKRMWIGISVFCVTLVIAGITSFVLLSGNDSGEQASNEGDNATQTPQTSTGGAAGNSTQGGGPSQGSDMSSMMSGMTDPGAGGMDEGMMDPSNMGEGMMDPGAGGDPGMEGGDYGGAGPGTDPSLGGGDPATSGNFGAGPGTDPSLGGSDPAASGNFGAGPGTDPSAGGGDPFGNFGGNNNGGGIPNADLATIQKGLSSNSYEAVMVANFQLMRLTTNTLKKMSDAATALAQIDQLKQFESGFSQSAATMKRLEKPTRAEQLQLAKRYGVEGNQILKAFKSEGDRVLKIKGLSTQVKLQIQKTMQAN